MLRVAVGKHLLEFSREGFNPGKFPFEIGPDDVSGGSVSFELGASAHDTIELRDGGVLSGDLVSVSGMEIVVRGGGTDQKLDRNQVNVFFSFSDKRTNAINPPGKKRNPLLCLTRQDLKRHRDCSTVAVENSQLTLIEMNVPYASLDPRPESA